MDFVATNQNLFKSCRESIVRIDLVPMRQGISQGLQPCLNGRVVLYRILFLQPSMTHPEFKLLEHVSMAYGSPQGFFYGVPKSTSHLHPKFQTEQYLEALIDRVACQTTGPRVVMGDFNWEQNDLRQLRRLEDMGFCEIQGLASEWWGSPILPTGSGSRRIDFVYISKELIGLFNGVHIDNTQWPDHASVAASFHSVPSDFDRYQWFLPRETSWPTTQWNFQYAGDFESSPTVYYADLWNQIETSASSELLRLGKPPLQKTAIGRGQTLEPTRVNFQAAPIRKGRSGEMQPEFFGSSVRFAQLFKQARRFAVPCSCPSKSESTAAIPCAFFVALCSKCAWFPRWILQMV